MKFPLTQVARLPFPLRVGTFVLILAAVWLPFVGLAYALLDDLNTISIGVMSLLFVEFLVLLRVWGIQVRQLPAPLQHYGLVWTRQNGWELLEGLSISFLCLFAMFWLEGALGWLNWRSLSADGWLLGIEGLGIALGVGLGEELIFRGWLLDELQRDYRLAIALWVNVLMFACLHFIRPLNEIVQTSPQVAGLFLLGLMLVWAKRATQRLGLPIGLHAGLIWSYYLINVGQRVTYTGLVPQWITGVNQNPLAGVMGITFLGMLAGYTYWRSHSVAKRTS